MKQAFSRIRNADLKLPFIGGGGVEVNCHGSGASLLCVCVCPNV